MLRELQGEKRRERPWRSRFSQRERERERERESRFLEEGDFILVGIFRLVYCLAVFGS